MDAAQAASHAHQLVAGRRYVIPIRPGPVLAASDHPRVGRPGEELFRETRGMGVIRGFP